MMILLDTHTILWFMSDNPILSDEMKKKIGETENIYVSIASFWEMQIKENIGKLPLKDSVAKVERLCKMKRIMVLPIEVEHIKYLSQLPMIHNDPFDRILISQAKVEDLTIITKDRNINQYDVNTMW